MAYNWNNYNKPKKNHGNNRIDHQHGHRRQFEINRRKIIESQEICALCGLPVDKSLKFPDPYSATVDHIIPVSRGGHPSDLENLQLAHLKCNCLKSDKLKDPLSKEATAKTDTPRNDDLPHTIDWRYYRCAPESDSSNAEELGKAAEEIRAKGYQLTAKGIVRDPRFNVPINDNCKQEKQTKS